MKGASKESSGGVDLPATLAERLRPLSEAPPVPQGEHVLYWMHHAVRGHENPALDVARLVAEALGLPLLVYQGLGGAHRFNNDRHYTFILEGARNAREELADLGIRHVLWLGEDPEEASPLRTLATTAAVVITEDFPAPPLPRWTAALARRVAAPVWAVDTACVVPMRSVPGVFDRAFRFRDAIRTLLAERLTAPWPEIEASPRPFPRSRLAFEDADLAGTPIPELVARCAIDHSVGPVPHTPGGSRAGYERWEAFRAGGLRGYAARRNDAAADGVSRLSPYLHHGHVSPLRIAREAAAVGGKGAEKYLDELIVWRELAHNLCSHRHGEVESLAVLPNWARECLAADPAEWSGALSWERLARGRTGDPLWDLCQASLRRHGELHNNVRMTWGKAILDWAGTPERALALLIDLNHRFALDGSDPNSYGGLLWCLGLFDRPFAAPESGKRALRDRSTASHARRLDLQAYGRRVLAPATGEPLEVAVVGAGLSGSICARILVDHGHRVRVFEKSRGSGGRMSTRRAGEWRFDHGAQYFTARDERFSRWVEAWRHEGVVEAWDGEVAVLSAGEARPTSGATRRYVAQPGMSALCRHLAAELEPRLGVRVTALEGDGGRWRLSSEDGEDLGSFDAVVVSAPAAQAAELLQGAAPHLAEAARSAEISPCWAVMAGFEEELKLSFDGAFVEDSPLSWVARNGSKPGRPEGEAWVFHATPDWSTEHLEDEAEAVVQALLAAFAEALGRALPQAAHGVAHRWRFALPTTPLAEPCLFDGDLGLAACGDWCGGPRVEGAFLSGAAAAGRLLGSPGRSGS